MFVISKTILNEFAGSHQDAANALRKWYEEVKSADWKNFTALKNTFNTADHVGNDRYVFDIKGKQYRLIALIIFRIRTFLSCLLEPIKNMMRSMPAK